MSKNIETEKINYMTLYQIQSKFTKLSQKVNQLEIMKSLYYGSQHDHKKTLKRTIPNLYKYLRSDQCANSQLNLNPLCANFTKWSNTLGKLPTNCLSVFDHFVKLALKGLRIRMKNTIYFQGQFLDQHIHQSIYSLILTDCQLQNV